MNKVLCRRYRGAAVASAALVSLAAVLLPGSGVAGDTPKERPKWELGIGTVLFNQPDYVGSNEYRFHALPLPWIIYRGERLRLTRDSIQTKIFGTDRLRLDISAGGQTSVDSDDNDRRHGMRDLDWIAQLGPTLHISLLANADKTQQLDLDLPIRAALAVDVNNFSYEGFVASPKFQYRLFDGEWRFDTELGLEFADHEYDDYIYGVKQSFATASRPAYKADGGYSGLRFAAGAGRYFGPFYFGMFARYMNLDGASFVDSPLVADRNVVVGGIAIGWVFKTSSEMVPVGRAESVGGAAGHPEPAPAPHPEPAPGPEAAGTGE